MLVLNKRTSKKILYTVSSISILLLCIPIALRFYKQIDDTLIIETIDVGKGQAILIEHKGRRVLVDAGEKTPYFDVAPATMYYRADETLSHPEECVLVDISSGGACIESEYLHA